MKYPKRSQYKHAKSHYRIGNWPEYEAGLRRRGELTVWLSEDAINSWRERPVGLPIPDHTTLSRRLKKLIEIPFRSAGNKDPTHLLIDSTGLGIHVGPLREPPKRRAMGEGSEYSFLLGQMLS